MITLKHKKTESIYYIRHTFPNNKGEITLWITSKGYNSLAKLSVGQTVYDFIKDQYPMLEIIEDNTFH